MYVVPATFGVRVITPSTLAAFTGKEVSAVIEATRASALVLVVVPVTTVIAVPLIIIENAFPVPTSPVMVI